MVFSIQKILAHLYLFIFIIASSTLAHAVQDSLGNYIPPLVTPLVITPDTVNWNSFNAFPPGAEAALISGDPRETGPFMLRIKLPPKYKIPPNWQTVTIYVTVLKGVYGIGAGDTFDRKNGKVLPSTGAVLIPANTHLYFWSDQGAILEVHGIGPWDIHYVNSKDDPRNW